MGKFEELRDKAEKFEIKKSWQYLAYIAVVLPGILFLLAYLLRSSGTGVMLARMFHTYNLYVSSPVPNLAPFNGTGVVGLAALALVNATSAFTGIALGLNLFNALVVGVLGVPGLVLLILVQWVLT